MIWMLICTSDVDFEVLIDKSFVIEWKKYVNGDVPHLAHCLGMS